MANVTIKDIAKKAGVSHQTVSKILHNRPSFVGQETKDKVMQLVRELNYQPNYFARQLKQGKTNCIGLLGSSDRFHFGQYTFTRVAEGIENGIQQLQGKYSLVIFGASFDETYKRSLEQIENGMVNGLLLIILARNLDQFQEELVPKLTSLNLPFVVIHSCSRKFGFNNVGIDAFHSGYQAAGHLISLYQGPAGMFKWWTDQHIHSEEALAGFKQAHRDKGIGWDDKLVITPPVGGTNYQMAYQTFKQLKDLPRGIYFRPDAAAFGALKALKERGIRVPGDVAVIGNNDEDPAEYFESDLTTFYHPFREKGEAAVKMLTRIIEGNLDRDKVHQKILKTKLVVRGSCGANT